MNQSEKETLGFWPITGCVETLCVKTHIDLTDLLVQEEDRTE